MRAAPAGRGSPAALREAQRVRVPEERAAQSPEAEPAGRRAAPASAAGRASCRDSPCCRSGRAAHVRPAWCCPAPASAVEREREALPVEQQPGEARREARPDGSPRREPGAAGVLPAAARVPGLQDAADLRVLMPGAEPARREPAVPDEGVWPGRHRRAVQAAPGARPAGRARGGVAGGRHRGFARPGLRHATDGGRAPRMRRGRPGPVHPVGVRRPGGRRARRPGLAASGAHRAAAPHRLPVRPGPGRAALRAPMGGPRHAPAAASGGGRYSQETGWKAS